LLRDILSSILRVPTHFLNWVASEASHRHASIDLNNFFLFLLNYLRHNRWDNARGYHTITACFTLSQFLALTANIGRQ